VASGLVLLLKSGVRPSITTTKWTCRLLKKERNQSIHHTSGSTTVEQQMANDVVVYQRKVLEITH
jgi:hypothetical protein